MHDLKFLMRDHYIKYASYVILDRAIPDIRDGLKPVQRRILYVLHLMNDGKFHKVANVVGQTMAYHPHGDAPISEALIHIANKNFLLDTQGNFGNLYTGDPAAASRYIETRLTPLALETMFNHKLTEYVPSYDSRNQEPVALPAKIPLLLMQGAEGIAVGMATRIFPHNFRELVEAEIAILENRPFRILPDFVTGGLADVSEYHKGRGKIRLRAKIDIRDTKTIVIREICYGTTTESLISSIDDAAKKGKIKIDSIHDYTAEKVEIEIKLPRGVYAEEIIDHLYAYTECEVTLNPQMVVIKDGMPVEMDVDEILRYNVDALVQYLRRELELHEQALLASIFERTLEQLFIEKRLYKNIEEVQESDELLPVLEKSFKPYFKELSRVPVKADYDRLLQIPIRRISRFDREKNQGEIKAYLDELEEVRKSLADVQAYTIEYLRKLLATYASDFPRKTKIRHMEEVDLKAIETKEIQVGIDKKGGYIGTKVDGKERLTCTNFDKLLILYKDGLYKVINIPEKQYVGQEKNEIVFVGVADKVTTFSVVYKDASNELSYAKRFVIKQFILEKSYRFIEEGCKLQFITTKPDPSILIQFVPKPKQKMAAQKFEFSKVLVKSVTSHGIRIATRPLLAVSG